MKECSVCNKLKPRDLKHYGKSKRYEDGFKLICRECLAPHRKAQRDANLEKLYGITRLEYNQMLKEQHGVCKICGQSETKTNYKTNEVISLAVDHNHETGEVRGLLCSRCNLGLGYFKDNTTYLQNAIKYLKNDKNVTYKLSGESLSSLSSYLR